MLSLWLCVGGGLALSFAALSRDGPGEAGLSYHHVALQMPHLVLQRE